MARYLVLLFAVLALAACGGEPMPTPDAVATQEAVEKAAYATLTAEALAVGNAPTPTEAQAPKPTLRPTSAPQSLPATSAPRAGRGWLCDYDKTGAIRLWTAASMQATVKDIVGTCIACCVDVTMHEEKSASGILFYNISVGGQSGWVDVDYFYWRKPSWCSN